MIHPQIISTVSPPRFKSPIQSNLDPCAQHNQVHLVLFGLEHHILLEATSFASIGRKKMSWTLTAIPNDVLDQILSSEKSSMAALGLWLTGDKLMQHRIARSVSVVTFQDQQEFSTSRFPKFIENLTVLKSLTIIGGPHPLLSYRLVWKSLRHLPQSLKKLVLRYPGSSDLLVLHPLEEGALLASRLSSATHWTMKTAFPELTTLEVHGIEDLSRVKVSEWTEHMRHLPSSLTDFTAAPFIGTSEIGQLLPRQLQSLSLPFLRPSAKFFEHLPPHLTRLCGQLDMYYQNTDQGDTTLKSLPRTLTEAECRFEVTPDRLQLLPRGLTTLHVPYYENNLDFDLGGTFPLLKEIQMQICSKATIRSMPDTVKSLSLAMQDIEIQAFWPRNLTRLTLEGMHQTISARALPPQLLHLVLSLVKLDTEDISNLPRSLLTLRMPLDNAMKEFEFPPRLTHLTINSPVFGRVNWIEVERTPAADPGGQPETIVVKPKTAASLNGAVVKTCFPFEKIPLSVTELVFSTIIPATKLKYLPLGLKLLDMTDIFEDGLFEPESAVEVARVRENMEYGRREGICDFLGCHQLMHASIATLLPRGLTILTTRGDAMFQRLDFKHLPPILERITFNPRTPIPGNLFFEMPMKHLRWMSISLDSVIDEHFKALPRAMETCYITLYSGSQLTPMVAIYMPPSVVCHTRVPVDACAARLRTKRLAHCGDDDPTILKSLLTMDNEVLELSW